MNIDKTYYSGGDHGTLIYRIHEDYTTLSNLMPIAFAQMSVPGNFQYRIENGGGDAGIPLEPQMTISNSISTMVNIDFMNNGNYVVQQQQQQQQQLQQQQQQQKVFGIPDQVKPQNVSEEYVVHPETVFVTHMNHSVSKHDIEIFFSRAGPIQLDEVSGRPKIFAYKNKYTGQSRGEATVTFTNANDAQLAIIWLNDAEFCGRKIKVMQAYISIDGENVRFDYARERQPLMRRARKQVWQPAPDNWVCGNCHNSNFVWRASCNRCKASKSDTELVRPKDHNEKHRPRQWHPIKTDWQCGFCFNTNFWHREKCNRCGSPKDDNLCQECHVMGCNKGYVYESSGNGNFKSIRNKNRTYHN